MNKSFFSRIFGGSETSEEDVAPDEALGEEAKNKSKIGSLFSRSKKTPGVVKKVGANSTSVRGAQYPPPTDDVPASFPEDMRESLGSSPPGGFSMSSSCGGIETGEIHNSTPPEEEKAEVAALDRSAERLKIDPFGAVKPLEKQKSGNDLGRQSFDSPGPEDDPSSPGSPKANWAPQGLGDRLLDPSSTGEQVPTAHVSAHSRSDTAAPDCVVWVPFRIPCHGVAVIIGIPACQQRQTTRHFGKEAARILGFRPSVL